MMNNLYRTLLAAGLAASLGVAAVAQPQTVSPPSAAASQPAQGDAHRARMEKKVERKLGRLKDELKITTAQEGAWSSWTSAVKPGPRTQRLQRKELAALSTPERIERLRAARALRNAEMDRRLEATNTFYATLTPEQKKVFDDESLRLTMRHHGKGGMFRRG